jgi:hypothetical protein
MSTIENMAATEGGAQAAAEGKANNWLVAFNEESNAALAKRAAEKKIELPPDEKALIAALAAKDHTDYDKVRAKVAETLGIRVGTLDDKVEAVRKKARKGKPAPEAAAKPDIKKLEAAAGDLITESDILTRFGKSIETAGLVGESSNAKILYLSITSRLFEKPVSIAIKGVSAGGKSFTVEIALRYFPASAFIARTGLSEKALYFVEESLRHRFLVVFEWHGAESDYLSYLIRTLLSENRICYEMVEKTEEGLKSRLVEKEGPTGLITTTTVAKLHPENETRLLSLGVIDTAEQTKSVMRAHADGDRRAQLDYAPWQAFQEWIAAGECRVVVPFAKTLADEIPPVAVRLRRDFAMLLSLIRAHALLHRAARAKDSEGRIIADVDDYAGVRALVADLWAEGLEATVPATMRETVEAVRSLLTGAGSSVSLAALAKHLKVDKGAAHHRVRKAITRGFLVNEQDRKGKPAKLTLGEPLPEDAGILPLPEALYYGPSPAGGGDSDFNASTVVEKPSTEQQVSTVEVRGQNGGQPNPRFNGPNRLSGQGDLYNRCAVEAPSDPTPRERVYSAPLVAKTPQPVDPWDDAGDIPAACRRCFHCNGNGGVNAVALPDRVVWLHRDCEAAWMESNR